MLNMMRNRTGANAVILGVALSEKNEETEKLPLPNNFGHVVVYKKRFVFTRNVIITVIHSFISFEGYQYRIEVC